MNRSVLPLTPSGGGQQAQVILVDGHKVTVRYSEQKNPLALRAIKDVLINSIPPEKT